MITSPYNIGVEMDWICKNIGGIEETMIEDAIYRLNKGKGDERDELIVKLVEGLREALET